MALYLFLSLLIIVLLILTLLQYLNTNRIVDQQLTQHKMMFPNQIRRARSVYMRGIFRANHRQRNLRTTAIVSTANTPAAPLTFSGRPLCYFKISIIYSSVFKQCSSSVSSFLP